MSRSTLWIVHREERLRAALRRLAGAADEAVLGAPDEAAFRDAPQPRVVLLAVAGDFEAELEFANRVSCRLPSARWLLLAEPAERSEAERLFDALPAGWLDFPPTAAALRSAIAAAARRRGQEELSRRRQRDLLAERFARRFADLELPEVLRALDPHLAGVPLLVRGEPGTGRSLLARYVHAFAGGGGFVEVDSRAIAGAGALRAALAEVEPDLDPRGAGGVAVCLRDADALPAEAQYALMGWIEHGAPGPLARASRVRWMATAGDEPALGAGGLAPELAEAIAGLAVRLPPLRERPPEAIERLAADTALAWCRAHGERPRRLSPETVAVLIDHPWPGNHRELEAVVARTLAAEGADPIRPEHLRFDPFLFGLARPAAPIAPERAGAEAPAPPGASAARGATAPAAAPRRAEPAAARGLDVRPAPPGAEAADEASIRRLARSLAHELRNRLVAIRTFAALLPERAADPAFRDEFSRVVGEDVRRIERAVDRLAAWSELEPGAAEPIDLASLLEERLEALRTEIESRRLLVLKELDRSAPPALASRAALAFAFDALLARALAFLPERGDLYLASKHVASGLRGGPTLRVALRFFRPGDRAGAAEPALRERELALEVALADLAIRSQGGTLRVDATDAEETLVAVDLPALA